jgi:hypothetical protein
MKTLREKHPIHLVTMLVLLTALVARGTVLLLLLDTVL